MLPFQAWDQTNTTDVVVYHLRDHLLSTSFDTSLAGRTISYTVQISCHVLFCFFVTIHYSLYHFILRLLDRPPTYSAVHKRAIIIQADRKSTEHSIFVNFQSASIVSTFRVFPYFCQLSLFHLNAVFILETVWYPICLEPLDASRIFSNCITFAWF